MLEELRGILNSLYCQYGLTGEVIQLSQVLDKLIYQEMKY